MDAREKLELGVNMKRRASFVATFSLALSALLLAVPGSQAFAAGSLDFENPSGLSLGTDWMSSDFPNAIVGASSSAQMPAELSPWAINDSRSAPAPGAWTLSVDLTGIPDNDAWVYLPIPIFTAAITTPPAAAVTGVPTAPTKINNTGGTFLGTNTGGGGGYYTISFPSPLTARVFPTATPGTYNAIWTVTLA